jgi:hypothetical protein
LESVTSGEVTYGEAPQGTGSDWKNLPGTAQTDRQTYTVALIYKMKQYHEVLELKGIEK